MYEYKYGLGWHIIRTPNRKYPYWLYYAFGHTSHNFTQLITYIDYINKRVDAVSQ